MSNIRESDITAGNMPIRMDSYLTGSHSLQETPIPNRLSSTLNGSNMIKPTG